MPSDYSKSCKKCDRRKKYESDDQSKSDSTRSEKPKVAAYKKIIVNAKPCLNIKRKVDTNICFPIRVLIGPPRLGKDCGKEFSWPKDSCIDIKSSKTVPVCFNIDTNLNPSVQIPVNVLAKAPLCAKKFGDKDDDKDKDDDDKDDNDKDDKDDKDKKGGDKDKKAGDKKGDKKH